MEADPVDELRAWALSAASQSYAPYTGARAGCAVETDDGEMYAGRYAENAAYNPSVSPLQACLALMTLALPRGRTPSIVRAALVELPALISQRGTTERLLKCVAPGVALECYAARERDSR